ncbi:MAG: OmpA family protein [bacterium]
MKTRTKIIALSIILLALPFFTACTGARCEHCGETVKVDKLEGVHFDFDKATIKPEGKQILDKDIALLKKDKTLDVSIEGHCDYIGSDDYNQKLSERRAKSVFDYLAQNGVDKSHMRTVGYGRSKPISPNDTDANRAKNRRVELHIIKARAK